MEPRRDAEAIAACRDELVTSGLAKRRDVERMTDEEVRDYVEATVQAIDRIEFVRLSDDVHRAVDALRLLLEPSTAPHLPSTRSDA